jgi:hypothetical protein
MTDRIGCMNEFLLHIGISKCNLADSRVHKQNSSLSIRSYGERLQAVQRAILYERR